MIELKPCPFCGKNGVVKKYADGTYKVCCENYLCPAESFAYHTEKEAVDWWNRRINNEEAFTCKTCAYNTANMERDPLDLEDYTDIVCSYWMSDGLDDAKDFCSQYKKMEGKQ